MEEKERTGTLVASLVVGATDTTALADIAIYRQADNR